MLVSTSWRDFVGNSTAAMRKISLTIIGRKFFLSYREQELREEIEQLAKSNRRYENFTFYAQKPGFLTKNVIDLLNSRKGKWKSVKIWSEKFRDEDQMKNLFCTFTDSVENLNLRNLKMTETEGKPISNLEFKKLQSLSLCNVECFKWISEAIGSCNLNSLEAEDADVASLIKFLKRHPTVEKLSVKYSKWNEELFMQLSKVNSLTLKEFKLNSQSAEDQNSLAQFLQSQADNLTSLIFDVPLNSELMQMIFKLPRLKSLRILTSTAYQLIALPTR